MPRMRMRNLRKKEEAIQPRNFPLCVYFNVHSVYISVLGHQQVATPSHELYKCLSWTINIDTLSGSLIFPCVLSINQTRPSKMEVYHPDFKNIIVHTGHME